MSPEMYCSMMQCVLEQTMEREERVPQCGGLNIVSIGGFEEIWLKARDLFL